MLDYAYIILFIVLDDKCLRFINIATVFRYLPFCYTIIMLFL